MKHVLYILFLLALTCCKGTPKELKLIKKNTGKEQYSDFVMYGNKIITLSCSGKLVKFDTENGNKEVLDLNIPNKLTHIAKDNNGDLIASDTGSVFKITGSKAEKIYEARNIKGLVFDGENRCFFITEEGILDTKTRKTYFPDSSLNRQIYLSKWRKSPAYLMDKQGYIWIGFGYGEWGGDLFIFNTRTGKFIPPNVDNVHMELSPVLSFAEGSNRMYVGCGLMHFMTSGSIFSLENFQSKKVFSSESTSDVKSDSTIEGEYIGPICSKEDELYFYSQNGIFKGNINDDLSILKNWTCILKPKLNWLSGQVNAVGSPMNVLKLAASEDEKMIFLSQLDGIGIFDEDENQLIMTN